MAKNPFLKIGKVAAKVGKTMGLVAAGGALTAVVGALPELMPALAPALGPYGAIAVLVMGVVIPGLVKGASNFQKHNELDPVKLKAELEVILAKLEVVKAEG